MEQKNSKVPQMDFSSRTNNFLWFKYKTEVFALPQYGPKSTFGFN